MEQEQSAYITSVHLKGYKSIKDVSVTLNKGLNILIGANGSGKTNFLEFLDAAMQLNFNTLLYGQKIEYSIGNEYFNLRILAEQIFYKNTRSMVYKVEEIISINNDLNLSWYILNEDNKIIESQNSNKITSNIPIKTIILKFENPLNSILKEKISLNLFLVSLNYLKEDTEGKITEYYPLVSSLKSNYKSYTFLNDVFDFNNKYVLEIVDINKAIEEIINKNWFSLDILSQNLKLFSPIKDLIIDWDLTRKTIQEIAQGESAIIEGIDFKFYVNNEWINWTQLSDGTKRLFYLIGSVTYATENEIILIEEPELGVHPYQLSLLMNFLKSQSRDKQIIISTHSPQVLNCLGEDELDRIIVARHEGKAGTKLYHLSDEEKGFAAEFMKNEAFLSDYWLLSGFMNEGITENL